MFKITRWILTLAVILAGAGLTLAAEYTIDPAHSQVMFKVRHLGISMVTGQFEKFSGTFEFDAKKPKASMVSTDIQVASINTNVAKRDDHLRTADFFDVEKFPEMKFVSKSVKDVKKDKFKIVGDLTMHGVTKEVILETEISGTVIDPWGNERAGFTAATTIHRKDFGLTWSKVLETGGLVVGEDVKIMIEIEGIRKKETK